MLRLRVFGALLLAVGLLVSAGILWMGETAAQAAVEVRLEPAGSSGVGGTASLMTSDGGTTVGLNVTGLAPGSQAQAGLHAGTCASPSASFAALPGLTASGTGRATASGELLFQGREKVALSTVADGEHVIVISQSGQTVACGVIPAAAGSLNAALLAEGEQQQVIRFNPGAALQKRIFADGFVPNSPEFKTEVDGVPYIGQRAEHLRTGRVRVYYAMVGDWGNVRFVERGP